MADPIAGPGFGSVWATSELGRVMRIAPEP